MDIVKEIKKLHKDIVVELQKDFLLVEHPKYKFDLEFDLEDGDNETLLKIVKETLECEYVFGKSFLNEDCFEIVVNLTYAKNLFPEENIDIDLAEDIKDKCIYEIGEISPMFAQFLKGTIKYDHFDVDYYYSLKIHNLQSVFILTDKEEIKQAYNEALDIITFDLHRKYDLKLNIVDFGNTEEHDIDFYEEPQLDTIEDTSVTLDIYDSDLVSYYNRASNMTDSEFKYLAYFQVLECIFDEVYKEETIQDVRGILQSSNFSNRSNEDISNIIKIVERYKQEKNDRSKTGLVLDKYFKGDLRKEAYNLVNKDIFDLLIQMKQIKDTSDMNDLNKLATVIYDFRNECTHSNRSYPIKNSTVSSNANLLDYILLIQKVAERIILNYKV
ncbi:methylamine utilization protein MauJ [Aquimarina algicola]|uniref:Apea-like HEPN domain-containing protein n=1 Tax=Aquimarina algicola TaxID=2589995 RepID=A0A504JKY3_9FLAO|nr:methylamine utilization protein MauJ [Aquimarina algicola]TPN87140.1 hypothetical protein FHK87_05985 [Aquimarina algicola]